MPNSKIDQIISKHKGDSSALIQVLLEIQRTNHWLPKDVLEKVSEKLNVPLSRVQRVATFHKSLSVVPEGHHEIHVCNGTGCHIRGAMQLQEKIENVTGVKAGERDPSLKVSVDSVACLGACSSGPLMILDGKYHSKVTLEKAQALLKNL
jgi:NADH-quinone oxidoreductase subunit E